MREIAEIENSQKVRVWTDNTPLVTAKPWIQGTREDKAFEGKLWFSDTDVTTDSGWPYVFGQASLALPAERGLNKVVLGDSPRSKRPKPSFTKNLALQG